MGHSSHHPDSNNTPDQQLEVVQTILFSEERERIRALEARAEVFRQEALTSLEKLQNESRALSGELQQAQADLGGQVETLRQAQNDLDGLVERLTPTIGEMIGHSIRNSRDVMAEALGPIMGQAIRVQIRDSRREMVDALYPVIGETVQKSLAEFARELQQNIDARLKSTFGFRDTLGMFMARIRGVSSAQLTLRQALPFSIKEIFLVQRESGLLVAHSHPETAEAADADLVSSMLTAIRDFVQDSYGKGQEAGELDEIQYGTQRIILVSGSVAYLAVVITGIEPEGFRAQLRDYLSELQVRHGRALREYNGDPTQVPNLSPELQAMSKIEATTQPPQPLTRPQRLILSGGALLSVVCLALSCFYLQFTLALLPVAFPPTATITPTLTITATPTTVPTLTPTLTQTPLPTATLTAIPSPTATPQPKVVFSNGNVWVRSTPAAEVQPFTALANGTSIQVLQINDIWALVSWKTTNGEVLSGWIPSIWLSTPPLSPTP
jgi:hypothetical protein